MDNLSSPDMTGAISNVLESLDVAGRDMIGKLGGIDGLGFQLLGILFVIMFLYHVIIFMLEGNSKVMVDLTKLTLLWVIIASMLAAWTSPASTGVMRDVSVAGFFSQIIPSISEKFTPNQDATAEIVDKYVGAMGNVFKVILNEEDVARPDEGLGTKIYNSTKKWLEDRLQIGYIFEILELAAAKLIIVVAAFFIMWSLLTFVFVLNAGQIMLYIGLAIGPILIPFLLIPNLCFLFNGWLRFMISAALFKIIAVLVALLALGTIDQITNYAMHMKTKDESMIFLSLMVLFFAMLGKQMMGMVDNISSSLASGGANSGGAGDSSKLVMFASRMGGGGKGGSKGGGNETNRNSGGNSDNAKPDKSKTTTK